MSNTLRLQVAARGVITLPKSLRQSYNLQAGDEFTLLDLGGVFVLSPKASGIDALGYRIAKALTERGETLNDAASPARRARALCPRGLGSF